MTFNEGGSFILASVFSVLTLSGMQLYRNLLASSQLLTIAGGFIGSIFYVFLLTALGNLEKTLLGASYQTGISEILFCLLVSVSTAASVHRVSGSTCLLFSIGMTWSLYKISQERYVCTPAPAPTNHKQLHGKKKR